MLRPEQHHQPCGQTMLFLNFDSVMNRGGDTSPAFMMKVKQHNTKRTDLIVAELKPEAESLLQHVFGPAATEQVLWMCAHRIFTCQILSNVQKYL